LKIPEALLNDHLIAKGFEKPTIQFGNYYLKWHSKSYGIQHKKIAELKVFIKDAIPFFDAGYKLLGSLERFDFKYKAKRPFNKELAPRIHLSQGNKDHTITYELYMKTDGSTYIDRLETIAITSSDNLERENTLANYRHVKSAIHFKWNLGELLFARQGIATKK
jgi:hypothetical protein